MSNIAGKMDLKRLSENIKNVVKENKKIINEMNSIYEMINKNNLNFDYSKNIHLSSKFKDLKIFIEKLIEENKRLKNENETLKMNKTNKSYKKTQSLSNNNYININNNIHNYNLNEKENIDNDELKKNNESLNNKFKNLKIKYEK